MSEPIRLMTAEAQEVGSYFVANYPPFSVWTREAVPAEAHPALDATWRAPWAVPAKASELFLPDGRRP